MSAMNKKNPEPTDVLYRVKRGLAAYVSYLAACEMNQSFSEYVLYEPILRILTARGFVVECEHECPGIEHAARGDKKRIDFYVTGHNIELAIEVKWAKTEKPNVKRDVEKLQAFLNAKPDSIQLLCVFGRKSILEKLVLGDVNLKERGEPVYADLGKTRYGCRIFQMKRKMGGYKVKYNPLFERGPQKGGAHQLYVRHLGSRYAEHLCSRHETTV